MPLPSFFKLKKTKSPTAFLAFDINSRDVKCLVFELPQRDSPDSSEEKFVLRIIGAAKQKIESNAVRGGVIIEKNAVENALDVCVEKALNGYGDSVDTVLFGVNGDVSLGIMTTAKIDRPQSVPIDRREYQDIYQKTLGAANTKALEEYIYKSGYEENVEPVTTSVVYAKADGTYVPGLMNLPSQKVEIALFTAFTPVYHTKVLADISKNLKLNIFAIGSDLYALSSMLRASTKENNNYVVINMASDFTDVGVVFGRGVVATKTLNIGRVHFAKEIGLQLGVTLPEAEKALKVYASGKLSDNEGMVIQEALQPALEVWLSGIQLLFSEFSGVKTFAAQIFLAGSGFDIPDVNDYLTSEPWTKTIPFRAPPTFDKLRVSDLPLVSDTTGKLGSLEWTMPASLAAIYLEISKGKMS